MTRRRWTGLVAIALALPGLWIDRPMFFACWLAAWWLALSVVLGTLANAWIHRLTGGRWGDALRPATGLLATRMPSVLLLFVPLLFGLDGLYPWLNPSADWRRSLAQPAFNMLWLSPGFFAARLAAYALAWWWMARAAGRPSTPPARAAAALMVHAVVTSLAAIDLLMSLLPLWYSTVFGLLVLTGQLLAGTAVAVAMTAHWRAQRVTRPDPPDPPVWRDLGNLLLTWLMSWAYLAFMQLLIIWAEDLPREIAWYVPRLQTGWRWIGVALVALALALPLMALLQRSVKDRPGRLAVVALALACAAALDAAWLVIPSVEAGSANGWWLFPLAVIGMGLLLFGDAAERLQAGNEDRRAWGHA